jgi:predicted unusual protein kinase regulating ubiquinone biosynthesis (AarF/ABC1/UbiB family)
MSREPVATASIGQVHRAKLPGGRDVAVKVLHPGITEAIRADFRAASAGKVLASVLIPGANVGAVVAEAEARLSEECNYALERKHQQRFGAIYAKHQWIHIPAVEEAWCSPRVLTTEWRTGIHIDAFARTHQAAQLPLQSDRTVRKKNAIPNARSFWSAEWARKCLLRQLHRGAGCSRSRVLP